MNEPKRYVRRTVVAKPVPLPAGFPQGPEYAAAAGLMLALMKAVGKLPLGYRAQSVTVLGRRRPECAILGTLVLRRRTRR